jgi:hypothetical protein
MAEVCRDKVNRVWLFGALKPLEVPNQAILAAIVFIGADAICRLQFCQQVINSSVTVAAQL